MQDEIDILRDLDELSESKHLYNDATGEVSRDIMERIFEKIHYKTMPFSSYRWFQDPNAWRMFASQFDFYLGDRLHGGIVALQTGVPAILISEDQRVSEVANFFGIPEVSIKDIKDMRLNDVVSQYLIIKAVILKKV